MGLYGGFLATFTPTTSVANHVLETVSGSPICLVREVTWGGQVTTSTAMQTRLARDSAIGTGGRTAGNTQKLDQHSAAAATFFSTTYATLQPTVVAGALWGTSWNAHGGVVRWLADPSYLITAYDAVAAGGSLEVRSDVGTATSSYHIVWAET